MTSSPSALSPRRAQAALQGRGGGGVQASGFLTLGELGQLLFKVLGARSRGNPSAPQSLDYLFDFGIRDIGGREKESDAAACGPPFLLYKTGLIAVLNQSKFKII